MRERIFPGLAAVFTLVICGCTAQPAWEARYDGGGDGDATAYDVAVDGDGNVYVTGASIGKGTSYDYVTVKYDSDGTELWVARYNGPDDYNDVARSVRVDGAGNVYVTGTSEGVEMQDDYATVKYDPNGIELWVAHYNGPGDDDDEAQSVRVDGAGNVYVTGTSYGVETQGDYATVKYGPDGAELWVARHDGPAGMHDEANALAVDGDGNVYVTGYTYQSATDDDITTIMYDTDGTEIWAARYSGPTRDDHGKAIAVDDLGYVYVTGESYGNNYYDDYVTIKYDPEGSELWAARYNGPVDQHDKAEAVAVDAWGNVYVTGTSDGGTGGGAL
ncbi:SBBP repeat-containing protein [Thermodesulfobacteriota bacterium]